MIQVKIYDVEIKSTQERRTHNGHDKRIKVKKHKSAKVRKAWAMVEVW